MSETKEPLLGKTLDELRLVAGSLGMPRFAAGQMAAWLYRRQVRSIDAMTDLSAAARERLKESYEVGCTPPESDVRSADGTVKYLFRTPGGCVESVYIPDGDRATLCVSSQVGCKMNCTFCMTGRQGYTAGLTAAQILNQVYSLPERERLTNIVFMGMGEPMDNLDAVLRALEVLTAPYGYAWSPRRITVSTVGLEKGMKRFIGQSQCHLAVSLHSPFHEERAALMPAEKAFPAGEIVHLLRGYDFGGQRRLSFEYILFRGLNDTPRHARALVRLLSGLQCRVNLIRFHAIPGSTLEGTDRAGMEAFRDYLTAHGLFATIRASRGEDIFAACGMLSTARRARDSEKNHQTHTI